MSREQVEEMRLQIKHLKEVRSSPSISNKDYLALSSKIFGLENLILKILKALETPKRYR